MSHEPPTSPNETQEDEPGERLTLSIAVHLATSTRRTALREGAKPARPAGRVLRLACLLGMAHHFQRLLDDGLVETQAELAAWPSSPRRASRRS